MAIKKQQHPLLDSECVELLLYRINEEEFSSRLYEAMSLFLNNKGYMNAAKLWKRYSEEELTHAQWAKDYLLSFGMCPCLQTIQEPDTEFTDLAKVIELSYEHEVEVSKQCKELAACALGKGDFMLFSLAQKYCAEQVEELDKLQTLKDQLEAFGRDKIALRLLDHELASY